MLTIPSSQSAQTCDGRSRRNFLKIGGLAMGGLSLPELLRAEAAAGISSSNKSVIMVYLAGGPSHSDMWDLKPDAPSQYRGEFNPIATNAPGVQICEHFPRIAKNFDKFAALRTLIDSAGQHSSYQCETGWPMRNEPAGKWPSMGAVLAKNLGTDRNGVPPAVTLNNSRAGGGFLGSGFKPFQPNGKGRADMTLNRKMTVERLEDRQSLLSNFDQMRRDADRSGLMEGLDEFNQTAFEVITSSELIDALDVKKAKEAEVARYSKGIERRYQNACLQFLTARRLVEAGSRYVTLSIGGWDTHRDNFKSLRERLLPVIDRGVGCLVEDLHESGMSEDVSVVVWGEFGRTPKVNTRGGRDHWPRVTGALVAGGGMRTGQAIGETDRLGGEAENRPIHFGEVFSTLYHNCGLTNSDLQAVDLSGRPLALVNPSHKPMKELI
ncbi:MAG: DUF1501 domain-containing protein [Verrucomicrobiales bacterium]|nr:DUF1501 domain-containing protein [Verrucomicrobiales bacterium]